MALFTNDEMVVYLHNGDQNKYNYAADGKPLRILVISYISLYGFP